MCQSDKVRLSSDCSGCVSFGSGSGEQTPKPTFSRRARPLSGAFESKWLRMVTMNMMMMTTTC